MEDATENPVWTSAHRPLFGWKLLVPCLVLTVLAFGAAAFYVGWTMGQDAIRVPLAWRDIPRIAMSSIAAMKRRAR
jgi:hypothetical protein